MILFLLKNPKDNNIIYLILVFPLSEGLDRSKNLRASKKKWKLWFVSWNLTYYLKLSCADALINALYFKKTQNNLVIYQNDSVKFTKTIDQIMLGHTEGQV